MNIGTLIESKYMGREDDTKLGRNIQKEDRIKENIHLEEEIKIVPHMPGVPYLPSPAPHIPIPAINPGMSHHYKQLIETIQDCDAIWSI